MVKYVCDFCGADDKTRFYYQLRNTISDNVMVPFDDWHICNNCLEVVFKLKGTSKILRKEKHDD